MDSEIKIERLSEENVEHLDKCDGTFVIESELVVSASDGAFSYVVSSIPPYRKRYVVGPKRDLTAYINNAKGAIYLAFIDGQVAGQLIITLNWNHFALIEDLEVDTGFRRRGVASALIQRAIRYAKSKQAPGLMLETQTNNVPACMLYQKSGFQLGGFDNLLYSQLGAERLETALFWYLPFTD